MEPYSNHEITYELAKLEAKGPKLCRFVCIPEDVFVQDISNPEEGEGKEERVNTFEMMIFPYDLTAVSVLGRGSSTRANA